MQNDDTLSNLDLAWEEEDAPRTRQTRKKKRGRKRRSYAALVLSVGVLVVLGAGVFVGIDLIKDIPRVREWLAADYEQGDMGEAVPGGFEVRSGDGGTTIANRLLDAGAIKSVSAFLNVCEAQEQKCLSIQPGIYPVHRGSPAAVVFGILIDPLQRQLPPGIKQFQIIEGMTVIQTLAQLEAQTGIPLADFQAAISDPAALGITPDWYTRTDGKPSAVTERGSIEGFLFPSTYQYDPDTATAHSILKQMVDQFFVVAQRAGVKDRATFLGISPYEVIVTASLLQKEGHGSDFDKIARVAYNRVYKDMISCQCLQYDSTAPYWLEVQQGTPRTPGPLTSAQLNDAGPPSNTDDKTPGMPIGPISNPSEAAIYAAGHPADGDWIYFVVVRTDGTTAFSSSWEEFCDDKIEGKANGVDLYTADC